MKRSLLLATTLAVLATPAFAAFFIVPADDELLAKSTAVVIGTIEGSYVRELDGNVETVYELRVERALKGAPRPEALLRVVSPGGHLGDDRGGVIASGAAHFAPGERVLLFLLRHKGAWAPTDNTLGKFRFETSTRGERVLVRDLEDVVGWDRAGNTHVEKVRREEGFLRFLGDRVAGRPARQDYLVNVSDIVLQSKEMEANAIELEPHAPAFPAPTYSDHVTGSAGTLPTRWANGGIATYFKRSDTNISGAADGGVSVIQGALAAWTNEPASTINLTYGGQRQTPSADRDGINIVEFNDPQGRIAGSWTGAGTVGMAFHSYTTPHDFPTGTKWWSFLDSDVVFQDGYTANASFATAMTHEVGHGLGYRHSNAHYFRPNFFDEPCQPSIEECSGNAIMNSSSIASLGFNLQAWDQNACQAIYPGTSQPPCTLPTITSHPQSQTITAGSFTTLQVSATTPSGTLSYQWFVGTSGNTAQPIGGATGPAVTVGPSSTTNYWVRVTNSCGSVNSNTATVTVTSAPPPCTPPSITAQPTSRTINAGQATTLNVSATGTAPLSYQWFIGTSGNTAQPIGGATGPAVTVTPSTTTNYWVRVSNNCGTANSSTATVTVNIPRNRTRADFDGDGISEALWRHTGNQLAIWDLNGRQLVNGGIIGSAPGSAWRIEGFGDFNRDNRYDIFYRNTVTNQTLIWLMNGRTLLGAGEVVTVSSSSWQTEAFGDFTGDGRTDILWRHTGTGDVALWEINGTTLVNGGIVTRVGDLNWRPMGAGDFDGDGDDEVVWYNSVTRQMTMWFFNGRTLTSAVLFGTGAAGWQIQGFGDFNSDDRDDILWRNTSTGDVAIWDMNGTTVLNNGAVGWMGSAWRVDAIGDYDGDGDDEILWFNTINRDIAMWELANHTLVNGGVFFNVSPDWRLQPPFLPVR